MRLILASGVSLLEVLVSLLILSLVLLGLDALAVSTLRLSLKAYYADLAGQQLLNMEERLQLRSECSQALAQWNEENRQVLPQGRGRVSGQEPVYTLTIYWGEAVEGLCNNTVGEHEGCLTETFVAGRL